MERFCCEQFVPVTSSWRHHVFLLPVHPSIPFLWTWYLKNALRELPQIWYKYSLGLEDELIRLWCLEDKGQGHNDLMFHWMWHIWTPRREFHYIWHNSLGLTDKLIWFQWLKLKVTVASKNVELCIKYTEPALVGGGIKPQWGNSSYSRLHHTGNNTCMEIYVYFCLTLGHVCECMCSLCLWVCDLARLCTCVFLHVFISLYLCVGLFHGCLLPVERPCAVRVGAGSHHSMLQAQVPGVVQVCGFALPPRC